MNIASTDRRVADPALLIRVKTRQLVLLAQLGAELNLGRAAAAMAISQPAATKLLQQLEQLLGATLFDRRARGMRRHLQRQLKRQHLQHAEPGVVAGERGRHDRSHVRYLQQRGGNDGRSRFRDVQARMAIHLITRRQRALSPAAGDFVQQIADGAGAVPQDPQRPAAKAISAASP